MSELRRAIRARMLCRVVRIAPRYHPAIVDAVFAFDDRGEHMAEICRRVASDVEKLGVTRPSYVHLRRLIKAKRDLEDEECARRRELLQIGIDVYVDMMRARVVDAYEVAERVREAKRR